jgi:translation elongation factor EF-Ts
MEIYKAQAAESGKPENIQEKIATGRLEKYYAENCLTEQAFVKDGDEVKAGQKLLTFDRDKIKKAGYSDTVVVLLTNSDDIADVKCNA